MKNILTSFVLFCIALSALANRTELSSAAEINSGFWVPGDTLVMKNGFWTDQNISLKASGTAEQAIVLMAETPGEVILNGSSKLGFSGEYIEIYGLYFKDGNAGSSAVISFRTSSSNLAFNCRVSNTTIENYNPGSATTDSKWVSIYGENNKVDHCSFVNKTNSGTLLVVWLDSRYITTHIIEHNYFGYRNPNLDSNGNELNGQEIIRIGDSSHSMQSSGCVVSDNFFEHCNGETEIISNKSGDNIYRNNVFYECVGTLTLRHGNRCTVEGNYFFGSNIDDTGGVRIIGEDHKVYNNYFENLDGSGYRSALCIVRGVENSPLNRYFQVKNANVMFNTMVNCRQAFSINYKGSDDQTLPPIGTTIAHNHVYNSSSGLINVSIYGASDPDLDVTWKNNLMNQGVYQGFSPDTSQVMQDVDPSMVQSATPIAMYEPEASSALANYSTDAYLEVSDDIRGRDRGALKIPGASQLSGAVTREMPTRSSAGSDYYIPDPVRVHRVKQNPIGFTAYAFNKELFTKISEPGILTVYDLSGRCVHKQHMTAGSNISTISARGIYILRFYSDKGNTVTKKIAFN